jgi:hypothetical protein
MVTPFSEEPIPKQGETGELPSEVEFVYGIEAPHEELNDWIPARVVAFRVTKKTARRVYYNAEFLPERYPRVRFVDRIALERDGKVHRRSAGWWEPDITVYLQAPELEAPGRPDVADLKARMAAAHPDRGGSDEAFIQARALYLKAKERQA